MSSAEDYAAKLAAIEAIPDDQLKSPNMPVDVFLQEVENTVKWVQDDKDKLVAAGLDWTLVDDMPIRAGALREAQSLWYKERFAREEAQKEWSEKSPDAYDLRDTLLHVFRYAFRNEADLTSRIAIIAEGSGNADMIQDLNDLSLLGKDHTDLLTAVGFDVTTLDTAASLSAELATLYSEVSTVQNEQNTERIIRDKAYVYVKQALDEIRNCGQYVFWRNDARLKGYVSQYYKNRRKKNSSSSDETTT
ncbi:MAG: hypothetical protein JXI43_06725 [Tissierellales bacterium]|nr:hypothetical protein [Tissierellales bacterium]